MKKEELEEENKNLKKELDEIPLEDLNLKIGSKKEAELTRIFKIQKETILKTEINLAIDKVIRDFLEKEIEKEKEKFKNLKS